MTTAGGQAGGRVTQPPIPPPTPHGRQPWAWQQRGGDDLRVGRSLLGPDREARAARRPPGRPVAREGGGDSKPGDGVGRWDFTQDLILRNLGVSVTRFFVVFFPHNTLPLVSEGICPYNIIFLITTST